VTHFADSSRADNEPEVLLEDGRNDLEEYSNVVQHVSKQPDNTASLGPASVAQWANTLSRSAVGLAG